MYEINSPACHLYEQCPHLQNVHVQGSEFMHKCTHFPVISCFSFFFLFLMTCATSMPCFVCMQPLLTRYLNWAGQFLHISSNKITIHFSHHIRVIRFRQGKASLFIQRISCTRQFNVLYIHYKHHIHFKHYIHQKHYIKQSIKKTNPCRFSSMTANPHGSSSMTASLIWQLIHVGSLV